MINAEEGEDIQSQVKIAKIYSGFVYLCQPNNCNNPINAKLIAKAVNDHYDMSAMYDVLKIEIEGHTSTSTEKITTSHTPDPTSTKEASTATSSVTTTKQPNNIATSLHISIIMIIFNTL